MNKKQLKKAIKKQNKLQSKLMRDNHEIKKRNNSLTSSIDALRNENNQIKQNGSNIEIENVSLTIVNNAKDKEIEQLNTIINYLEMKGKKDVQ